MATMFGRFEIQSELSKSETALIYKATGHGNQPGRGAQDAESGAAGRPRGGICGHADRRRREHARPCQPEHRAALWRGRNRRPVLRRHGVHPGQQHRHHAGAQRRLLHLGPAGHYAPGLRGLEHAATKGVVHYSLEPAKIMVQWDGLVKILGYGISNMSLIEAEAGNGLGRLMPYCSPEQIRGEAIDLRSNLFTLGTILYEMVAGRKAFRCAQDPVALVNQIENEMPPSPSTLNAKIQSGRERADHESAGEGSRASVIRARTNWSRIWRSARKATTRRRRRLRRKVPVRGRTRRRSCGGEKFVGAAASAAGPGAVSGTHLPKPVARESAAARAVSGAPAPKPAASVEIGTKAFAARAGASADASPGTRLIEDESLGVAQPSPIEETKVRSCPAAAPAGEADTQSSGFVDPMMSESSGERGGLSFSEMDELPPLKEPVFESRPAPQPEQMPITAQPTISQRLSAKKKEEKPKIQPRELAQKAMKEISTVPPRLTAVCDSGSHCGDSRGRGCHVLPCAVGG